MDKGAAEATPWKNALTRSLGGDDSVEVDEFGPFATTDPQVLLLCSDGVYKSVPDDLIERVVLGTPDVNVAAKALVDVAYRRGSDDNLSAVMIEFGYLQRTASPLELPPSIDAPPPVASHQGPSNGGTAPLGWPEPRPAEPRGDAIPTVAIRRVPPPRVRQRSLVSTSLFAGSALLLGLAVFGILRSRLADAGATPRLVEGSGAEVTVADTGSTGGPSSPSQDSPLSAGKTGLDSAPGQLRRGREEVSAAQSSPANAKGVTKERLLADPPTLTTADKAGEGSKGLPGGGARPSTTRDSTAPAAEPTKAPARERDPGEDQAPRVGTVVVRESTEAAQRPAAGTRSEAREGDTSSVGGAPRAEVPSADKQAKPDRERFKKEAKVLPKLSERARDSALTAIEARCLAANKAERSGLRNARAVRWIPGVAKDVYDCAIR